MGDPVGADHAGDPDVDHVRVDDVERDPPAGEQRPPRPRASGSARAARAARRASRGRKPDQSIRSEEVAEHRIGERDRGRDLAAVEEEERDAEAEQHEQVEVEEAERAAGIEERAARKSRQSGSQTYGALTFWAIAPE